MSSPGRSPRCGARSWTTIPAWWSISATGADFYGDPDVEEPRGGNYAALPADADPNYSTPVDLDKQVNFKLTTEKTVADPTGEAAGTVTINTRRAQALLFAWRRPGGAICHRRGQGGLCLEGGGHHRAQGVLAGLDAAQGNARAPSRTARHMDGALNNPLGARALYLFQGKTDTLFRIHGTNEPKSIGHAASSGCIRMQNADVINLYGRVTVGTKVVVM